MSPRATLKVYAALATVPPCCGAVTGGFAKAGQVALQQDLPLPMNILALFPEIWSGDEAQTSAGQRGGGGGELESGDRHRTDARRRAGLPPPSCVMYLDIKRLCDYPLNRKITNTRTLKGKGIV